MAIIFLLVNSRKVCFQYTESIGKNENDVNESRKLK